MSKPKWVSKLRSSTTLRVSISSAGVSSGATTSRSSPCEAKKLPMTGGSRRA